MLLLGAVLLGRTLLCYLPLLLSTPRDPRPWTSAFELIAIGSAGLTLFYRWGRWVFAASLLVFAGQHFLYGAFIATLITGWIPGHLFWAYFVGAAFLAAALALFTGKLAPTAAALTGIMFLLWVLILHGPRVAAAPRNANEWTSLLIALAMSGSAFLIAGSPPTAARAASPLAQERLDA